MKKSLIVLTIIIISFLGCNRTDQKTNTDGKGEWIQKKNAKVTFIELGSLNCIPCRMMQPIMEEIDREYKDVQIVFYDVMTPEGRPYAQKYGIRAIPTQVFLDKNGVEYKRHVGFLPKDKVVEILKIQGIN